MRVIAAALARLARLLDTGDGTQEPATPRLARAAGIDDGAPELVPGPGDDDPPLGCGWFDSSWSLRRGLQVTEHATVQDLAEDVLLGSWSAAQSGHGPAPGKAAARMGRRQG